MSAYALATGAGKDATLALHRARARGLRVTHAFNIYEGNSGRVRFHGTRRELVEAHLRALDLEAVLAHTHPREFEAVFREVLDGLVGDGIRGVIFGNVHLEDVRAWYEERTTGAGLEHVEPLWDADPAELVREVVDLGYRAVVVSVDLERGRPEWLGRELDPPLIREMEEKDLDPCGERGEFHTFVRDGPEFRHPIPVVPGPEVEMEGHRLLDLTLE